jgi:hypothetical protein
MTLAAAGSFVFVYSYLADGGRPGVNWTVQNQQLCRINPLMTTADMARLSRHRLLSRPALADVLCMEAQAEVSLDDWVPIQCSVSPGVTRAAGIDDYGRDVMPDVDVPERQPLLANRASNTATPAGSSVD